MGKIIYLFFLFTTIVSAQANTQHSSRSIEDYFYQSIPGIIVGLILGSVGYFWNSRTQLKHYKRTSKDEEIDKWILELKNSVSKLIIEGNQFVADTAKLNFDLKNNLEYSDKHIKVLKNFLIEMELLNLNLTILLDDKGPEKELYTIVAKYINLLKQLSDKIHKKVKLIIEIFDAEKRISRGSKDAKLLKKVKKLKQELSKVENAFIRNIKMPDLLKEKIAELTKSIVISKQKEKSSNK